MTVPHENSSATFTWTGVETSFNPNFNALNVNDVYVSFIDAGGVASLLARSLNYNVVLGVNNAVTVTPTVAFPPAPGTVVVYRLTPAVQPIDFETLGKYSPEIHEMLHDAAAMRDGEQRRGGSTALRLPDVANGYTLPIAADRANKMLAADADGNMTMLAFSNGISALIGIASKAEAEAGVENTKYMSALRVRQAYEAWIVRGEINLLAYIPQAEHAAILARTSIFDCRPALLAAIADAAAGRMIYAPGGTYRLAGQVVGNFRIRGDGQDATVFHCAALAPAEKIFKMTGNRCAVLDLTLQGPAPVTVMGSDTAGIWFDGVPGNPSFDGYVRNVEVLDVSSYGILYHYSNRGFVEFCNVHDCGYALIGALSSNDTLIFGCVTDTVFPGASFGPPFPPELRNMYGIFFAQYDAGPVCDGFIVANCLVKNIDRWEGIDTHGGQNGIVVGNRVVRCLAGIAIGPHTPEMDYTTVPPDFVAGVPPRFVTIADNVIDGRDLPSTFGRFGIIAAGYQKADGTVRINAQGITITGNTIKHMGGPTTDGSVLCIQDSDGTVCDGNTVLDSYRFAACLRGVNTDFMFTNNVLRGLRDTSGAATLLRIETALPNQSSGYIGGNLFNTITDPPTPANAAAVTFNQQNKDIEFGHNRIVTLAAGGGYSLGAGLQFGGRGVHVFGSSAQALGTIADSGIARVTFGVNGAFSGHEVHVTVDCFVPAGVLITGACTQLNEVGVLVLNRSGLPWTPPALVTFTAHCITGVPHVPPL